MTLRRGRPTVAEISVAALRHNLAQVKSLVGPGVEVLTVVKADAYGHGAVAAARAFTEAGAAALGVATLEEGEELRRAGLRLPVLLLGGVLPGQEEDVIALDLIPAVWDAGTVRTLATHAQAAGRRLRVHVKLDTGMGRLGVLPADVPALGRVLGALPALEVDGVFSHLACAEDVSGPAVTDQLRLFQVALEQLAAAGLRPPRRHLGNSAAVMTWPGAHATMVRPGIVLYGVPPDPSLAGRVTLRPAMRLTTAVLQLKEVPAGFPVSYGHTFRTARPSRLASLPVGYADGYPRVLSNRASVLVRGQRAPVVGRVCMDHTIVDVTDVPGVQAGDEVVLWGSQGEATLPVADVAVLAETIPYELVTRVGKRVPRVYVDA